MSRERGPDAQPTPMEHPHRLSIVTRPGKGRAVVASTAIARGELIERCPVIVLSAQEREVVDGLALGSYYYDWGPRRAEGALVLGYGSLYNHSYTPNAVYQRRGEDREMEFIALCDIAKGDEITINYNGDPHRRDPLDFPVID